MKIVVPVVFAAFLLIPSLLAGQDIDRAIKAFKLAEWRTVRFQDSEDSLKVEYDRKAGIRHWNMDGCYFYFFGKDSLKEIRDGSVVLTGRWTKKNDSVIEVKSIGDFGIIITYQMKDFTVNSDKSITFKKIRINKAGKIFGYFLITAESFKGKRLAENEFSRRGLYRLKLLIVGSDKKPLKNTKMAVRINTQPYPHEMQTGENGEVTMYFTEGDFRDDHIMLFFEYEYLKANRVLEKKYFPFDFSLQLEVDKINKQDQDMEMPVNNSN